MSRKLYVHTLETNFNGMRDKIENLRKNKTKKKRTVTTARKTKQQGANVT